MGKRVGVSLPIRCPSGPLTKGSPQAGEPFLLHFSAQAPPPYLRKSLMSTRCQPRCRTRYQTCPGPILSQPGSGPGFAGVIPHPPHRPYGRDPLPFRYLDRTATCVHRIVGLQPCSGLSPNGYARCCESLTPQLFAIYLPKIYDLFTDRNKQRPYNQVVARRKLQLPEEQVRELTSAYRYGKVGPTWPHL